MKALFWIIAIAILAGACTAGNTVAYQDQFRQNLPDQSLTRSGASVSPRSEVDGNIYEGTQTPGNVFNDSIKEPMRSVTNRPIPDYTENDYASTGESY